MSEIEKLSLLKNKIFESNDSHCFIERERFLASYKLSDEPDCYAELLSSMLDAVSTPVEPCDIFVGRVIEDLPDGFDVCPNRTIFSKGHIIPNYEKLLKTGYSGILSEIKKNARNIGTPSADIYAKNADTVIRAIERYAKRYALSAKVAGNEKAHKALSIVPYGPAYDLYSALQSIWLVHMIASCYVGSRDYAFGYMDEYLYPYYLAEKNNGTSDNEIVAMLAGFFIKTNEICGRHTHNYKQKPVLSQASKQYVLIDGGRANHLSTLIIKAIRLNSTAQPTLTVVLDPCATQDFTSLVFEAMTDLTDKMQVYNLDVMTKFLRSKGLPEKMCQRPAISACCTFDICHTVVREEFYLPTVELFCNTLYNNEFTSKDELLRAYSQSVTEECKKYLDNSRYPEENWRRTVYVLDSLLLDGCNEKCEYPPHGLNYRAKNILLPGIATLGDSLGTLDTLVFNGAISYKEFTDALKANFVGHEGILKQISSLPRFGNDTEYDQYTRDMAHLIIDSVEAAPHEENEMIAPSFYSLERENTWAAQIPATPDGRKSGQPFSENQSPVYGADKNGVTALLKSISKLPFEKTAAGGLNLTFSSQVSPEILKALVKTYFDDGGLHVGITVLNRRTLEDAIVYPEKYPTLTVRLYGFSEYFTCLPEWQQRAVLNRTEY